MTILEYVAEFILGEPNSTTGKGESYWDCPNCGSGKFHSMPANGSYKAACYCNDCGCKPLDEMDLLALTIPNFNDRLIRLKTLKAEFAASLPQRGVDKREEQLRKRKEEAWVELQRVIEREEEPDWIQTDLERFHWLVTGAKEIAINHDITTDDLIEACQSWIEFTKDQAEASAKQDRIERQVRKLKRKMKKKKKQLANGKV